jgi:hypothetical protein
LFTKAENFYYNLVFLIIQVLALIIYKSLFRGRGYSVPRPHIARFPEAGIFGIIGL